MVTSPALHEGRRLSLFSLAAAVDDVAGETGYSGSQQLKGGDGAYGIEEEGCGRGRGGCDNVDVIGFCFR